MGGYDPPDEGPQVAGPGSQAPPAKTIRSTDPTHRGNDNMGQPKGIRVAVLVEKFYEDLELWYPVLRLREAGCDVKIVGPKAGETYASKHGYPARAAVSAGDVRAGDFDAVVIPGGYSPDHMRRHRAMVDLVTEAARQG